MKFKFTLATASIALLMVNNSWAGDTAYYDVEVIQEIDDVDGASYGPYPVAMSDDAEYIATYSTKAAISSNIDIGLPFTFNRDCMYDDVLCELEFNGSETAGDLSYENAYKAWRNAQADASTDGYTRYMFANVLDSDGNDQGKDTIFSSDDSSDVKITDVSLIDSDYYYVGYVSAPYDDDGDRDYNRRAFIETDSGDTIEFLPEFTTYGGFSSAYKIKEVTYEDGTEKTLVIGAASRSFPQDDSSDDEEEYYDYCYNSDEDDEESTYNELVYCPGFDTQAWAWDLADASGGSVDTGFALATEWLEDNEDNEDDLTFSASALDINASGIAVGTSTFAYSTSSGQGGRQRAIIMTPTDSGDYEEPVELTEATDDIDDEDDNIYNSWALTISDTGTVTGNREYDGVKGRNKPVEFFVYDIDTGDIDFPLEDLKVATTEQRLDDDSYFVTKTGANSRVYDANANDWIVGEVDDYDQTEPVYGGSARFQAAFLYDNENGEAWLINDLICSQDEEGTVTTPRYRITSARVINDDGTVLAFGYTYETDDDYTNKTNATQATFKLTPNDGVDSPSDSPNCWESDLLDTSDDETYERSGGAMFWLWLFAIPLIFIRRFKR